jgi:hypothetical protein
MTDKKIVVVHGRYIDSKDIHPDSFAAEEIMWGVGSVESIQEDLNSGFKERGVDIRVESLYEHLRKHDPDLADFVRCPDVGYYLRKYPFENADALVWGAYGHFGTHPRPEGLFSSIWRSVARRHGEFFCNSFFPKVLVYHGSPGGPKGFAQEIMSSDAIFYIEKRDYTHVVNFLVGSLLDENA